MKEEKKQRKMKTIDELTLMDDYMFAQVMRDTKHLKPLLEFILKISIKEIRLIEPQRTEKEGYESKGIRLDLYVTDENNTVYNVEVQATDKQNVQKRSRYYQSTIDISILHSGADYKELRKSYVIFICNYDPFNLGRVIYTFENMCREVPNLRLADETYKVFVYTGGKEEGISDELKEAILYLKDGTISGEYSQELDDAVNSIKSNEERRLEYMIWQVHEMEIREEARDEGRAEGREEGLEEGLEKGREDERLSSIRKIMSKLDFTAEKAMDFLDIPKEEQGRYILMMEQGESAYQPE